MEELWRGMPGFGEHGPVTQSFVTPWGRPHVPVYNTCGRYRVGAVGSRLAHWAQLSARTADPRDDQNGDGAYRRIQGYTNLFLATLKRTSQLPRQRIADFSEPAKTPHTSDGFSSWGGWIALKTPPWPSMRLFTRETYRVCVRTRTWNLSMRRLDNWNRMSVALNHPSCAPTLHGTSASIRQPVPPCP